MLILCNIYSVILFIGNHTSRLKADYNVQKRLINTIKVQQSLGAQELLTYLLTFLIKLIDFHFDFLLKGNILGLSFPIPHLAAN